MTSKLSNYKFSAGGQGLVSVTWWLCISTSDCSTLGFCIKLSIHEGIPNLLAQCIIVRKSAMTPYESWGSYTYTPWTFILAVRKSSKEKKTLGVPNLVGNSL